ncbi:DUF3098 domain-containing protein [uncultured Cytophaga sp.]|uniref:DUF3098 domain-containing protein n=1 Tax=uncultured Cytophaga sp. TaxID=160238 RepID=UPI002618AFB2|nr:DUF3098 domain-containing protein [uncultured Cytophaga sp.]
MSKGKLVFGNINYIIMVAGVLLMVLGYFVMASDTEQYGFGTRGLTVGPLIVLLGLIIEFVAIFYSFKKNV